MKKTIIKKIMCISTMLLVMIAIFGTVSANDSQGNEKSYAVNKKGESYGRQIYDSPVEEEPDFIAVIATNGKEGYVRQEDIDKYAGGTVNSPEEALEYMRNSEEVIKVPVYNQEGELVIGYFEVGE